MLNLYFFQVKMARRVNQQQLINEVAHHNDDEEDTLGRKRTIADRQSSYQQRARNRNFSPERSDPFSKFTPFLYSNIFFV